MKHNELFEIMKKNAEAVEEKMQSNLEIASMPKKMTREEINNALLSARKKILTSLPEHWLLRRVK